MIVSSKPFWRPKTYFIGYFFSKGFWYSLGTIFRGRHHFICPAPPRENFLWFCLLKKILFFEKSQQFSEQIVETKVSDQADWWYSWAQTVRFGGRNCVLSISDLPQHLVHGIQRMLSRGLKQSLSNMWCKLGVRELNQCFCIVLNFKWHRSV